MVAGALLTVLTAGGLLPTTPVAAATPDVWTGAYGDGGNTTNNPGELSLTSGTAARVGGSWTTTARSSSPWAPLVTGGYALRVVSPDGVNGPSQLTATSPTTGATLWTVTLPAQASYSELAISGTRVVVAFTGDRRAGGVVVVDVASRAVVWTRDLPPSRVAWSGNSTASHPYTDGQRVFVTGAFNTINAYRLTDGAPLWTAPFTTSVQGTPNGVDGLAVGNGVVYTGGDEGIVAHDAATGRRLWTGPGAAGLPVVSGGRVHGTAPGKVLAYPAAGCGAATCAPRWSIDLGGPLAEIPTLGGADSSTIFATWTQTRENVDPAVRRIGRLARLDGATGRIVWSVEVGRSASGLVRGADVLWFNNEFVRPSGSVGQRIAAYDVTGRQVRLIDLPSGRTGFPQQLAVGAGTLFQQTNGGPLGGFRPGAPANAAPTASFTAIPVSGLTVSVNGLPSSDVDGQVVAHAWDFGDGTTATGAKTGHTYSTAGTYTVTLTVTDDDGARSTARQSVTVAAAPVPGPAPAPGVIADDAFGRTVSGGLGRADLGGAWTTAGTAANIAVDGGAARLTMRAPGTQVSAWLGDVRSTDTDLRVRLSADKRPTGNGAYVDVVGRRVAQNTEYRARLVLSSDGRVDVALTALRGTSTAETLASAVRLPSSTTYGPGSALDVPRSAV
ncbi:MAG: PQQ-binding-like beta-propeller repeat protein, partial [Blastococcus sp.]|nr:PQQ-binding-like beta-propeller repeat protein [Blastococcus sp.]